jgi:hypothetical protein
MKVLVGKNDGMEKLGRHKCEWENNIKIDIQEMELINLAQ